jgi:hypothetical protein
MFSHSLALSEVIKKPTKDYKTSIYHKRIFMLWPSRVQMIRTINTQDSVGLESQLSNQKAPYKSYRGRIRGRGA